MKTAKRKRISAAAATAIEPAAAPVAEIVAVEQPATSSVVVQISTAAAALESTAVLEVPAQTTVALQSNCTVKDAAALKEELLKVLESPAAVALDVRSVERVDTATMQLLCAFVRDRAAVNLSVQWLGCPPAFVESARVLGVHSMLALPAAEAA